MPSFFFPQANCVLIHIPKNAGSSIRIGFFNGEYEGPVQGAVPEQWQQHFKFAFVRNPYDRLISAWKMFTKGMDNTNWKYPVDGNPDLTLEQFLHIAMDDTIPYDPPADGSNKSFELKLRHHSLPQTHPYYCLDQADFIGRFETIQADFKEICKRLELDGELPHWNVTDRDDYKQYFDNTTKQLATEYYAQDLTQFGYSF